MFRQDLRHINTSSDSEVLLNVLAHELELAAKGQKLDPDTIFTAVANVHRRCRGAYAVVAMIAGYGLLAFRDPFGIRPLVIGRNRTDEGPEYLVASESVALTAFGFELVRDVQPGEAVFVDEGGTLYNGSAPPSPSKRLAFSNTSISLGRIRSSRASRYTRAGCTWAAARGKDQADDARPQGGRRDPGARHE